MPMKRLKAYKIEIFGLKNGSHEFNFEFDEWFFIEFEGSLIDKGKGTCSILMNKTDSMITLDYNIQGVIELECDRSLKKFDYSIEVEKQIIYKYGDEQKELSEDIFVIPKGEQEIRIDTNLYELISLEIPMKKLHPKFTNESEGDEVIYSSEETKEEESVDPRWKALEQLNNKNYKR